MSYTLVCAHKRRYDRAGAMQQSRWLHRNHDENVGAYRCRYCGWYHLGRSDPRYRKGKRRDLRDAA